MPLRIIAAIVAAAMILFFGLHLPLNDVLNGTLEWCGAVFIGMSVRGLYHAKLVRGVSWKHVAFFSTWGFWNIYYYASLDQWFSWAGGLFLVATNTLWLIQIAYYLTMEKRNVRV